MEALTSSRFGSTFDIPSPERAAFSPDFELLGSWPGREPVLAETERNIGPILPAESIPTLHRALADGFERLARVQARETGAVAATEVVVLDSRDAQLFVRRVEQRGIQSGRSVAFVTSGYLRRLLTAEDVAGKGASGVASALTRVLGGMAFGLAAAELGFGSDKPPETRPTVETEMRCDLRAAALLESAGLPPDAWLRALEAPGCPSHRSDEVGGWYPDEPAQNLVRVAGLSRALERLGASRGLAHPALPLGEGAAAGIRASVDALYRPEDVRPPFVRPRSLGETVERLERLLEPPAKGEGYLLGELERRQRDRAQALEEGFDALVACLPDFLPTSEQALKGAEVSGLFALFDRLEEWPSRAGLQDQVRTHPFYGLPSYQTWFEAQRGAALQASGGPFTSEELKALGKSTTPLLSPADFVERCAGRWEETLAADLEKASQDRSDGRVVLSRYGVGESLAPQTLEAVAALFHERFWKDAGPAERLTLLCTAGVGPLLPAAPRPGAEHGEGYRAFLDALWEDRHLVALAELLSPEAAFPWPSLLEARGLEPARAAELLDGAVRGWLERSDEDPLSFTALAASVAELRAVKRDPTKVTLSTPWHARPLVVALEDGAVDDPALGRLAELAASRLPGEEEAAARRAVRRWLSGSGAHAGADVSPFAQVPASWFAEEVDAAKLDPAHTRELLGSLLEPGALRWTAEPSALDVYRLLSRHELLERPSELLEHVRDAFADKRAAAWSSGGLGIRRDVLPHQNPLWCAEQLTVPLLEELEQAAGVGAEALRERILALCAHLDDEGSLSAGSVPQLRLLRSGLAKASRALSWEPAEAERLFATLTRLGPLPAADLFFAEQVSASLTQRPEALARVLHTGALDSPALQLELTRWLLEPRVAALEASGTERRALERQAHELTSVISAWVRRPSSGKDAYLEELAWRLGLEGPALDALLEARKGAAPGAFDATFARLDPEAVDALATLGVEARAALVTQLCAESGAARAPAFEANLPAPVASLVREATVQLPKAERGPLLEVVLTAGAPANGVPTESLLELCRRPLGLEPGSSDERLVRAWLSARPPSSRAHATAELLAGDDGGTRTSTEPRLLGRLLESAGIFLEPGRVPPPTKKELETALTRTLSETERGGVRLERLVRFDSGSAQVEATVQGTRRLLTLARPDAEKKAARDLALFRAFVAQLRTDAAAGLGPALERTLTEVEGLLEAR